MHNINTYIGRMAAWHKLGTVTGVFSTWADILAHGGLDFDVFKSQLQDSLGRPVEAWGIFRWDKNDKAAYAATSNPSERDRLKRLAVSFPGAVGKDYQIINHSQGFEIVDAPLMATAAGAHYETAGVLGKGEVVWGLASLGQRINVGDDESKAYLLFSTSHDGSRAFDFRIVAERVVCQNTLDMAMSEKTRASLKVRHTANAQVKIDEVKTVLANMQGDITRMADKLNFLAGRKLTRESLDKIFGRLFPIKAKDDGAAPESSKRRDNILAEILKVYELNDGNAFPEQRGTAYNLLNAITNYTDHERSSKGDGRAESALFGSGSKLKSDALEVIMAEANVMPERLTRSVYVPADHGIGGLLGDVVTASAN